ncbi:MAG: phosphonoacetaldehyde hydrolase, partial [Anaerolineae bacterium]|nr:phosphonoacetaldehyde hydrolase [Anaerolineae bacterium]
IMDKLLPAAARQGYTPDAALCPSNVPAGRPAPWMIYQNMMQLGVYPTTAVVKVGDTLPDIEEGLNAGVWTIGVTQTGNELGLNAAEVGALSSQKLQPRLHAIEQRLLEAGAHYVVPSIADVPAVLIAIETRLQLGEQP